MGVTPAVVEGCAWPGLGMAPVVALSIHAPGRKGRSYLAAVGQIWDFARAAAGDLPLILVGDFNVAVGLRAPGLPLSNSPGERALLARLRDELDLIPCCVLRTRANRSPARCAGCAATTWRPIIATASSFPRPGTPR